MKKEIREERILDKIIISVYVAMALDSAEYELTGNESFKELDTLLSNKKLRIKVNEEYKQKIYKATLSDQESKTGQHLVSTSASLIEGIIDKLAQDKSIYIHLLVVFALDPEEMTKYLEKHPEAEIGFVAIRDFFIKVREKACSFINSNVYTNVAVGFASPFGGLLLMHLLNWICKRLMNRRKANQVTDANKDI